MSLLKLGLPGVCDLPSAEEMRRFFTAERDRYLRFQEVRITAEQQERSADHAMAAWANLLAIYYGVETKWPD